MIRIRISDLMVKIVRSNPGGIRLINVFFFVYFSTWLEFWKPDNRRIISGVKRAENLLSGPAILRNVAIYFCCVWPFGQFGTSSYLCIYVHRCIGVPQRKISTSSRGRAVKDINSEIRGLQSVHVDGKWGGGEECNRGSVSGVSNLAPCLRAALGPASVLIRVATPSAAVSRRVFTATRRRTTKKKKII